MKIVQLQVVPVAYTMETQCHAYLYALSDDGNLYFRRDCDHEWTREPGLEINEECPICGSSNTTFVCHECELTKKRYGGSSEEA